MSALSKSGIRQLVAAGQIEEAIQQLHSHFSSFSYPQLMQSPVSPHFRNLTLLTARLHEIHEQDQLGVIEPANALIHKNKINIAFLELLGALPDYVWDRTALQKVVAAAPVQGPSPSRSTFQYDAFLCFSSANASAARMLWNQLTNAGRRVFFSAESLKSQAGLSFFEKIQEALINSQHFILLSTPSAMASEWVKAEYETFFNECYLQAPKQRKLLLLMGEGFDKQTVPLFLRRLQFVSDAPQLVRILHEATRSEKTDAATSTHTSKQAAMPEQSTHRPKQPPAQETAARPESRQATPTPVVRLSDSKQVKQAADSNTSRLSLGNTIFWGGFLLLIVGFWWSYSTSSHEVDRAEATTYFQIVSYLFFTIALAGSAYLWYVQKNRSEIRLYAGISIALCLLFIAWTTLLGPRISPNEVALAWVLGIFGLAWMSRRMIALRNSQ